MIPLLLLSSAQALPSVQSSQGSDDDAQLELQLLDQVLVGDSRSFCELRIQISGRDVEFSAGDEVFLWLYEDDLMGDDELWSSRFSISGEELQAQWVDRVLDCAASFGSDIGGSMELYAEARVEKDECGTWCSYDRPETGNLSLEEIDDDSAEEDDRVELATPLRPGVLGDRIARDFDWFQLQLAAPGRVLLRVLHHDALGRINAKLYDGARPIAEGALNAGETLLESAALAPGTYGLRLEPSGQDFNFYDLSLEFSEEGCLPGDTEREECGRCGYRERRCEGSDWGPLSDCLQQGPCEAGEERERPCGRCGWLLRSCTQGCEWQDSECQDEGLCDPGSFREEPCPGGLRQLRCNAECDWQQGACEAQDCGPDEERSCYSGLPETLDVGLCREGRQRCERGLWAPCQGERLPDREWCGGGGDEDCDGLSDEEDPDCEGPADLGDPCAEDLECGEMSCLSNLPGGLCTFSPCSSCPPGAICSQYEGQLLCLPRCGINSDCRAAYLCAPLPEGGLGCLPRCQEDRDCEEPDQRCQSDGLCGLPAPDFGVQAPDIWIRDEGGAPDDSGALQTADQGIWPETLPPPSPRPWDQGSSSKDVESPEEPLEGQPVGCIQGKHLQDHILLLFLPLLFLRRRAV